MEHLRHFGLTRDPFVNDPLVHLYFASQQHANAERRLARGIGQNKGLCVLTGEEGTGKTMVIRHLLEDLEEDLYEACLLVPMVGTSDGDWVLSRFARQLGVDEPAADRAEVLGQIYEQLAIVREDGRSTVLIIDEAQVLVAAGALAELRGLLNLEYEERRLLSLVLVGLPNLEAAIAETGLAARVDVFCRVGAMDAETAVQYLNHRIRMSEGNPAILESSAIPRLIELAGGAPRRLNTLADNALYEAWLAGRNAVTAADVEQAVKELHFGAPLPEPAPAPPAPAVASIPEPAPAPAVAAAPMPMAEPAPSEVPVRQEAPVAVAPTPPAAAPVAAPAPAPRPAPPIAAAPRPVPSSDPDATVAFSRPEDLLGDAPTDLAGLEEDLEEPRGPTPSDSLAAALRGFADDEEPAPAPQAASGPPLGLDDVAPAPAAPVARPAAQPAPQRQARPGAAAPAPRAARPTAPARAPAPVAPVAPQAPAAAPARAPAPAAPVAPQAPAAAPARPTPTVAHPVAAAPVAAAPPVAAAAAPAAPQTTPTEGPPKDELDDLFVDLIDD